MRNTYNVTVSFVCKFMVKNKLWHLCRFAATCRATYNNDLVTVYHRRDLVTDVKNWQIELRSVGKVVRLVNFDRIPMMGTSDSCDI